MFVEVTNSRGKRSLVNIEDISCVVETSEKTHIYFRSAPLVPLRDAGVYSHVAERIAKALSSRRFCCCEEGNHAD